MCQLEEEQGGKPDVQGGDARHPDAHHADARPDAHGLLSSGDF